MAKKYEEYLESENWKIRSEFRKELDGYTCVLCGSIKSLEVHHRNYRNLYREKLGDLITLCKNCHRNYHDVSEEEEESIEVFCEEEIKLLERKEKISEILKLNDDIHTSIVTVKDKTDFRKVIDTLDDERREKFRESQDKFLKYITSEIEHTKNINLITTFNNYKKSIMRNREKEDYFEELDDMDREGLMKFLYSKNEEYNKEKKKIERMLVLGDMPGEN